MGGSVTTNTSIRSSSSWETHLLTEFSRWFQYAVLQITLLFTRM